MAFTNAVSCDILVGPSRLCYLLLFLYLAFDQLLLVKVFVLTSSKLSPSSAGTFYYLTTSNAFDKFQRNENSA